MFPKPSSFGVGAVIAAAAIAASSAPAHAFGYFTPSGSNLDSDAIADIVAAPGELQTFNFGLDLSLLNPVSLPTALDLVVTWDTSELVLEAGDSSPNTAVAFPSPNTFIFTASNLTATNVPLGWLQFRVLNGLTNDGQADLKTSLALAQFSPLLANVIATQEIDVQPAAIPTPALLPGLIGLGVAALRRKDEASSEESA
ncbi:PTPA-CTERM sorting domain-containing protein [Nodosilinea sp. PGN35]|uniref:PTPA-CTERM sorting domain-containing protein n=1 Tax=Nodosilinea sp. PGN35 TaxID=3020489 RepID=UPI0023B23E61|nr:PTPA-CTERM sorting domain-containing protein [Nodosilinea sp. TSF1-S3]MDF0367300.1 PTPA-CTERM sorting domain-containing protein [Nodosilinea sp. TSF1-S3]